MSANIKQMQQEIGEWSRRNFGDQPTCNACLGVVEEVGELVHAYLKRKQGIRGTYNDHTAAMFDAIGDAIIYLCDAAHRAGFDLSRVELVEFSGTHADIEVIFGHLTIYAGNLLVASMRRSFNGHPNPNLDCRPAYFAPVLQSLAHLGFVFFQTSGVEIALDVWRHVQQRDWTSHTENGVTS